MSIGPMEIIIVLALALLVLGPSKLPSMGRSLGKGIREFKHAAENAKTELGLDGVLDDVNGIKDDITSSLGIDELKAGFDDVKTSLGVDEITAGMGSVTAGVGGLKTAIANPKKAAKDAVMGKPDKKKKQKSDAGEAQPEADGPPDDELVNVVGPADAEPGIDAEPDMDPEPETAGVGV